MVVGVTGGIGSGKTTVLKMFQSLGAAVYIADVEAKKLMHESLEVKNKVIALFGDLAYQDGELNRKHISNIVFKDSQKLEKLNAIVHPAVKKHFEDFVKNNSETYIVYESALLLESGNKELFDAIVLVTASENIRIERVLKRDAITKEEVLSRIKNQKSDEEMKPFADYSIQNNDLEKTKQTVKRLHNEFLKRRT